MTFVESIQTCFVKYADFTGYASKSEFWWWVLFTFVASLVLSVASERLTLAFSLATLLPGLGVTTRRLHDTDRSGWQQLWTLIPIVGWVLVMVWCAEDSKSSHRFAERSPGQP